MDEELILEGLNKKDIKAFYTIYNLWFTQLVLFARKIIDNEHDAVDIVTDVYVKVWEHNKQFKSKEHLKAFLYKATRNSAFNYLRSQSVKRKFIKQLAPFSGGEESLIERYSAEAVLLERIYEVIRKLPERQREVVTLRYIEGKSNAEVAKLLQISEKTVYATCAQVVRKLRLVLSNQKLLLLFILLCRR